MPCDSAVPIRNLTIKWSWKQAESSTTLISQASPDAIPLFAAVSWALDLKPRRT